MPQTTTDPASGRSAARSPENRPSARAAVIRPPKIQAVRDRLKEMAYSLGPGAKLPTVVELRETLGISGTTLHTALGDLEAQGVLTRRHGVGIYVSDALHRKTIALLCAPRFYRVPGLSPFWDMLVEQARKRAAENNEAIQLHFIQPGSDDSIPVSDSLRADLESKRMDGLLVIGADQQTMNWLTAQDIPVVIFAGPGPSTVTIRNENVVTEGVSVLAARGCQRIALWSPVAAYQPTRHPAEESAHRARFRAVLAEAGIAFDPSLYDDNLRLIPWPEGETYLSNQEQGYDTARRVFSQPRAEWPDGIISTDDMLTRGALTYMERSGIRVGADVRMVSHGNVGSQVLLGYEDDLTLIEVDPSEVVGGMFSQLETMMRGETPDPIHLVVYPKRRIREGETA
jgi:DNA-binding LacI/PurR family transcriptional regulator